jgi:hypothetical protein
MEQFEQFINHLLKQADQADTLRSLVSDNSDLHNAMYQTIDTMLLETNIAAQFDLEGYENEDKKQSVLAKLSHTKMLLDRNLVPASSPDQITIQLCIKYVNEGFALTSGHIKYLNSIYNRYA